MDWETLKLRIRHLRQNVRSRLEIEWATRFGDEVPVIVYQMGKVASTAVARCLRAQCPNPVYQVHRMTEDYIDEVYETHRRGRFAPMLPYDYRGRLLYKRIVEPRKPAYLISLVRDPVARNISGYFQNRVQTTGVPVTELDLDVPALTEDFLETYPYEVALEWFDRELKRTTGIDIFAHAFDPEQGHRTVQEGPFQLLVVRTDLPDEEKGVALGEFLGETVEIRRFHESADKAYAEKYAAFKSSVELPDSYLDRMYDSRLARHFFSTDEIDRLRARWSGSRRSSRENA